MAKKTKAVYAPGELSRVRGKLGVLDEAEAKRMAQLLGGDVGYERTEDEEADRHKPKTRRETVELVVKGRHSSGHPRHRIDMTGVDEAESDAALAETADTKNKNPGDDPSARLKLSYFERIKIDRYASLPEFDIKSSWQVLVSVLAVFSEPHDYVSPIFVTRRLNEYYRHIEQLVNSTRALFPRNNMKRSERIKKTSPFVFSILDTIRYWNIERITSDMARIQAHPRSVKVSDFAEILRAVYKPLFILGKLNTEAHIKGAYKLLYKVLYIENPDVEKEKNQELIRTAVSAFIRIRNDIHYLLYPLLMKLISDRWFPYELFFTERRQRFLAFLRVSVKDQIDVPVDSPELADSVDMEAVREDVKNEMAAENADAVPKPGDKDSKDDDAVPERKARETAWEAEQKALDKSLATLEHLFPRAGWDRLGSFPDLYPYFADTLKFKKGYELIAPTDPMQQVSVLMHILGDLFFALRYVTFGTIIGPDGSPVSVEDYLGGIINNWQGYITDSFEKEYLPRLVEYCQILEQSPEARTSVYAKRICNEINWIKRLHYLPHYKLETIGPPPFKKGDITPVYGEIKLLRRYLTVAAAGIEQGNHQGGAESAAPCDGIDNPWERYNFQVPNPISMRLDMLLAPKKRTNAALIFFCLSVAVVLDHLVNDENSWAYESRSGPLFRSVDGAGVTPLFGVENKLDAELIFKTTLKQRQSQRERQKGK